MCACRRALRCRRGARRWERAVARPPGCPCIRLPSGAGHDAMKLHELHASGDAVPARPATQGISHNPLETITSDDMQQLCVDAFTVLLEQLADGIAHERTLTHRLDAWIDAHFDAEVKLPASPGAGAYRHAARQ